MPNEISSSFRVTFEADVNEGGKFLEIEGEMIVKVEGKAFFAILDSHIKVKPKSLIDQLILKTIDCGQHFLTSEG